MLAKSFVFILSVCSLAHSWDRIIDGTEVDPADTPYIVQLKEQHTRCTGVVVGPSVVATAAHCFETGIRASFFVGNKKYSAKFERHPHFDYIDFDLALGIVNEPIEGVAPVKIGLSLALKTGYMVDMFGFGCNEPNGTGIDRLRLGRAVIRLFKGSVFKTKGDSLCFGDSGSPALLYERGQPILVGVGSTSDLKDTAYFSQLSLGPNVKFLKRFAAKHKVTIETY